MEAARTATSADAASVEHLVRQAAAELRAHRGGAVWSQREAQSEPLAPRIASALAGADPADHLVVGTVDDVVVGYGWSRLETLHDGTSLLVVSDLYVDPEARAIGVGEAMMDQLVAHARAAGAIGIDAIALPGDRHTKNFFETFGLTARAIVVHRSLLEPSEESG